jgi:choline dehydrogenase-like flavoprotein
VMDSVEVKGRTGKCCFVKAAATVLCAGGIENARLLLASNRILRNGVGNANDIVGRFLMDHPRGAIGEFENTSDQALHDRFGLYRATLDRGTYAFTYGASLSPDIQREEKLLNSAVWISEVHANDDPWMSVAAIMRRSGGTMRHLRNAASNIDFVISGLKRRFIHHRGVTHKLASLNLECIVEQRPDPDSRVTLADRVDALGMPISRIDWRVSEQEGRTVKRLAQLFSQEMFRLGLACPKLFDMARSGSNVPLSLPDVAHPIGTTRMSADPKTGVVDSNCAVHGVAGLYIAGSSVFASSGHANPTQLIIVLCIRLADHLRATLSQSA